MSSKIPKSWGLKTKKRADGKLDILGKTDFGDTYRVRTTDGSEVTDHDLNELKAADRESYSNPTEGAHKFIGTLTADSRRREQSREDEFQAEMVEAAGPVSYALLDRTGHSSPFTGSTYAYRRGWEIAFERKTK